MLKILLAVVVLYAMVVASAFVALLAMMFTTKKQPYEVELTIRDEREDEWSEDDEDHWRDFTTRERIMMDSDWGADL